MSRASTFPSLMLCGSLALAAPAAADVVTDWNITTLAVIAAGGRLPPTPSLDLAIVHLAMHDAIQSYQRRFEPYSAAIDGATGSPIAAAAKAARDVLVNRFPTQAVSIDATYLAYLAANGLLPSDPGVLVGQRAADAIIDARADDGSFPPNPEVFLGGTTPGQWRPTPPAFASMSAPWAGAVRPFAWREDLLPGPPPPHLASGQYAKAYNEVKALGARVNSDRTAEQTDLAYFYSDNFSAMLNRTLRNIAATELTDIGDSARLFALAHVAAADALISCWNVKRYYYFWRPSTAIHEGDNDGNPQTDGDPLWLPLINDPPYPDYTSGANSLTAAMMRSLWHFFGSDHFAFTVTTLVPQAIQKTRTYTRFSDVMDDVVEARILLGIHFRFADSVARRQGMQAADWAFSHILRPRH
jgi:hypothetical protein